MRAVGSAFDGGGCTRRWPESRFRDHPDTRKGWAGRSEPRIMRLKYRAGKRCPASLAAGRVAILPRRTPPGRVGVPARRADRELPRREGPGR